MARDLDDLTRQPHDLVVIGGGIHGLFAAYDAAARGLSVVLVERDDFGSGLSFNHQRTIHGGLRAIEHGRLGKTRQQIAERRTWARIAPHLLRPLPFLIGTYRFTKRSRWMLKAGFTAYDAIGRGRNAGVSPELHLPKAKLESAAATRRLFPGVAERRLTGGAVWYDYQTKHPDRLTWTVALAARQHGATLLNYVEAIGPSSGEPGVQVRDTLTGREFTLRARAVILAAGSGLGRVMSAFGVTGAPPLVRAMNLLIDRPARDIATAAPGPRKRVLTAVPWRGFILVGTGQSETTVEAGEGRAPDAAVDEFLAEVNQAFPRLSARREDIRLVHHGLAPAAVRGSRVELLAEPRVVRHPTGAGPAVVSMVGVKYTTARRTAAKAVDAVCAALGRGRARGRTADATLPHAGIADVEGRLAETLRDLGATLDRDVIEHLASWYGTEAADVVRLAAATRQMDRLSPATPVIAGEITYAIDTAQAVRLSDAVLRRTALGSAGHPGREALDRAADVMAARTGWTPDQRAAEIAAVDAIYPNATAR